MSRPSSAQMAPGSGESRYQQLTELLHSVSSTLEQQEALNLIIDAAMKITRATSASLILVDWEARLLNITVYRGFRKQLEDTRLRVGEGITGWVAANGQPLLVADVSLDERYVEVKPEIRSEMAVPLTINDDLIGVVNVDSTRLNAFSEEDLDLLILLSKQSAQVIHNARLYERMVRLEEETRRFDRLAAVGELAVGIAHEIRNPLTIIKMIFDAGEALTRRDREVIGEELARMNQIIMHLLDYTRPKEPVREWCRLNRILENALFLLSYEFDRKKISVRQDLVDDLPKIFADPVQLQQVFLNLLLNAGEALPESGQIRVATRFTKTDGFQIHIQDNGTGISEEVRRRLFTPFATSKPTGLGLGLSIVKRIIDAHQGEIRMENALKGGTLVRVFLPGDA